MQPNSPPAPGTLAPAQAPVPATDAEPARLRAAPDAREAMPWIHRTQHGVQVGGETAADRPRAPVAGLVRWLGEAWRVRRTLFLLVERDFKVRYRAQSLGLLWSFANPLVMMGVMSLVLVKFMKSPVPNFPVFYLLGALLWQFFNNAITAGAASLVDNVQIVKRSVYPRQLVPLAPVLSQLLNLAMESLMFLGLVLIFPGAFKPSPWLLLVPAVLAIEVVMLFGITLATSVLNVIYRDVFYVITSGLLVLFWLTPIIYPVEAVEAYPGIRRIVALNPLTGVISGVRTIVMEGRPPSLALLLPAAASALVIFVIGAAIFRRLDRVIADHL